MDARLNFYTNPVGSKALRYISSAGEGVNDSTVPNTTLELVRIGSSQINGCGCCLDLHTKDAAHAGEAPTRVNLVETWREATVYTDAERAALELAEQGTRIADRTDAVTDEAWANAAKQYDEDQLAALVGAIAIINAFNAANVMLRQPGGEYYPGQLG